MIALLELSPVTIQVGYTLGAALVGGFGAFFGVKYRLNGMDKGFHDLKKVVGLLVGVPEKLANLESAQDRMRDAIKDKRKEDGEFRKEIRTELNEIKVAFGIVRIACPLLRGEPCKGVGPEGGSG